MSKRHRANLKRLLVAKYRTVWTSEQIMCLELKPINYKISKSILTLLTLLNLILINFILIIKYPNPY
jgi:hypothetical protein